jgi:uncharacterized protein YkwD
MGTSILSPRTALSLTRLAALSVAALVLAAVLFGGLFTSGAQAAVSYSEQEIAFVNLLNDYRASKGLSPLLVSDLISDACDKHNSDMAKYQFFSHYSEKSDWFAANATPWDRMAYSGYDFNTSEAENIAAGQPTAQAVFDAWKASSGHNANMLGVDYKVIGVSFHELAGSPYTFYWTTDFGGYVDSTAHTVTSPPAPTTVRVQQSDPRLAYSGTWNGSSSSYDSGYPDSSGSSYKYVNTPASVTVKFTGTYLAWVTKKGTAYGYAKVTLDGGTSVDIDLYNGSTLYQQKVWNTGTLSNATHTVKIEWTGIRRSAATACNIGVDALDIDGSLVQAEGGGTTPTVTRYQQDAKASDGTPYFVYAGTWSTFSTSSASSGNYARARVSTSTVTFTFNGTALTLVSTKGTTMGKALVSLDGEAAQTVDLYNSSGAQYQQKVWSSGTVPSGQHTVKISWSKANASTKYISVDAVDVVGTLVKTATVVSPVTTRYEQSAKRGDGTSYIAYAGTWATFSTSSASGGSYARANKSGASATITFTGTYMAWIATAGTTLGYAHVSLDGAPAETVDLARSAVAYQQKVWNTGTLSSGQHTVKIWWDPDNLTDKYISVDAVEVQGTLN